MTRAEQLKKLYEDYRKEFEGYEIVVGDGNIDARLLLIGEAPGRDEVRLGKPFVGAAGKNLTEFLELLGIDRNAVYITNAIKYRLSRVNDETGRVVNRPATGREIDSNRKYLREEVSIIGPLYIVTLGNVPLKALMGDKGYGIGQVHGRIQTISIAQKDFLLFPLYHPASIIYNRSLKDVYIKDVMALKEIL